MFYLFNSNNYLGGGETIFSRLALYLSSRNIEYELICCDDSFLQEFCVENCIPHISHPINQAYHAPNQFVVDIPVNSTVFVCQLKDLYNLKYLCDGKDIKICYLYYHLEDFDYLDIWNLYLHSHKHINMRNLAKLNSSNSLFFPSSEYYDYLKFQDVGLNKAIPGFQSPSIPAKSEGIIKVLCISRFVDFKTGSMLSLFILLKKFPHLECTFIGYGKFEIIIRAWSKLFGLSARVLFVGKVDPCELDNHIDNSDVCFAQGTSLLQCVSRGKPTIIQCYSSLISMFWPSDKCGGLWCDDNLTLGEFYDLRKHDIRDVFQKIQSDYSALSERTIFHSKNVSEKITFEFILNKLEYAQAVNTSEIEVPRIPFLKILYFKSKGFLNANL